MLNIEELVENEENNEQIEKIEFLEKDQKSKLNSKTRLFKSKPNKINKMNIAAEKAVIDIMSYSKEQMIEDGTNFLTQLSNQKNPYQSTIHKLSENNINYNINSNSKGNGK